MKSGCFVAPIVVYFSPMNYRSAPRQTALPLRGLRRVRTPGRRPAHLLTASSRSSIADRKAPASSPPSYDASRQRTRFHVHKDFGLVNDVYRDDRVLTDVLKGHIAIGHNRYSTAGASNNKANIQPFTVLYRTATSAIAHNGNLTNFREIRADCRTKGTIFQTTSDTEIILHLIARSTQDRSDRPDPRSALAGARGRSPSSS